MKWWEVCHYHSNCVSWYFCLHCVWIACWAWYEIDQDEIDIFKLQALTEGCLLSEHRHLYSYRSCHLLTVFLLFEMLQSLWLAVKGNCLVIDHYHDKLLGHWQKHFSDKNWLNGILLHMFLISHMGIKFLSFCMLKLKSCLARLNLVGPWLGEEWGRFWLDLRFK